MIEHPVSIQFRLHITLMEVDGELHARVLEPQAGKEELVDVTDEYEVLSTIHPQTSQTGFVVLKKPKEGVPND